MRVLEVSDREEAAAYCGKLFARWGSEVIKVESPGRETPATALELYLNGGKQRLKLDLDTPDGMARLSRLAETADVVVTDHSPRETDALGLMKLPAKARLSVTPFGLDGPYRDHEATASTLLALGGYTWLMGDPDRQPLTLPGNYPYYQAGTFAYIAALAALLGGASHERPSSIEVSAHECLAGLHQFTDTMYLFGEVVRSRHGNRWENLAPTTLLRCHDGWYGVNILANFWFSFAHMIGKPEWATEGVFSTNAGRMTVQDELEDVITKALWDKGRKEIFKEGQEAWRVPIGYAATVRDILEDPHLNERGFWRRLDSRRGSVLTAGSPFRIVGEEMPPERAPLDRGSGAVTWSAPTSNFQPPTSSATPPARPLAGVRILDLTRIWSGPLASRILGDLGAEVIKIEAHDGRGGNIRRPDGARVENHWNRQPLFNKLSRNKKSVAIDLKASEGRDIFLRLVEKSDVVMENFSARAMPALGLSYDAMKAANPSIIYVPMPAFGLSGPYRDYIGLGPSIEPVTGMTALLGYSDDEPRVTSKAITDAIAGSTTAAAVLMALVRRSETGLGCHIDLSQHETGVAFFGEQFIASQLSGKEPTRLGNAHADFAPWGVYRCLGDDDWIAIAVRTDDQWNALASVLGLEDNARFATLASRLALRQELDVAIEAKTGAWRKRDLEAALQAKGVTAGSVLTPPEWLADPHLEARAFFATLEHREAGATRWDGIGVKFQGASRHDGWVAAPCLGEHNRTVLSELLGLTDEELDRLYEIGVLAEGPKSQAEE